MKSSVTAIRSLEKMDNLLGGLPINLASCFAASGVNSICQAKVALYWIDRFGWFAAGVGMRNPYFAAIPLANQ